MPSGEYTQSCRTAFDQLVMNAGEGVAVMHSCSTGQSSWYSERGGFFTQALLRYASSAARASKKGNAVRHWYGVDHVFQEAYAQTYKEVCDAVGRVQTPEILPVARPNFPLAIA